MPFGAVVIRNGYIVLEVERDHSSVANTKNVMSCAKAICATGKRYSQYAIEALLKPVGIEKWGFEIREGDEKHGNHVSHTMGLPAREMARIAYCMLRAERARGDRQVIPRWFVEPNRSADRTLSQAITEKSFGRDARSWSHGWELPALEGGKQAEGIPPDARYKPGSGGQLISFVPSLDLVLTRQTGKSGEWNFEEFVRRAAVAVLSQAEPQARAPTPR